MNGEKEDIFMFVFVAAFLVAVCFLCTGRSTVHDLRERAEPIRTELGNAQAAQRREAETIERASEATRRSTEAISNSQRATEDIKRMERKDAEIITECQSILRRVRARGRTQD